MAVLIYSSSSSSGIPAGLSGEIFAPFPPALIGTILADDPSIPAKLTGVTYG